jgi:hypothetical protein
MGTAVADLEGGGVRLPGLRCLERGAAIAFNPGASLAPVLLIVVAIAGLVFGQGAARGAISEQLVLSVRTFQTAAAVTKSRAAHCSVGQSIESRWRHAQE